MYVPFTLIFFLGTDTVLFESEISIMKSPQYHENTQLLSINSLLALY